MIWRRISWRTGKTKQNETKKVFWLVVLLKLSLQGQSNAELKTKGKILIFTNSKKYFLVNLWNQHYIINRERSLVLRVESCYLKSFYVYSKIQSEHWARVHLYCYIWNENVQSKPKSSNTSKERKIQVQGLVFKSLRMMIKMRHRNINRLPWPK